MGIEPRTFSHDINNVQTVHLVPPSLSRPPALIETLSEDRASVMQEKKHLEEELNRIRSAALISSTFLTSQQHPPPPPHHHPHPHPHPDAMEMPGATAAGYASEFPGDPERLASVAAIREDELDRVDSAVEASMVTMQ